MNTAICEGPLTAGMVIGSVAGAAIISAIIAFVVIKKKKGIAASP